MIKENYKKMISSCILNIVNITIIIDELISHLISHGVDLPVILMTVGFCFIPTLVTCIGGFYYLSGYSSGKIEKFDTERKAESCAFDNFCESMHLKNNAKNRKTFEGTLTAMKYTGLIAVDIPDAVCSTITLLMTTVDSPAAAMALITANNALVIKKIYDVYKDRNNIAKFCSMNKGIKLSVKIQRLDRQIKRKAKMQKKS